MGKRFITSDPHIGHPLVAKIRGFAKVNEDGSETVDVDAHNDEIVRRWNSVVGKDDLVIVAGDAVMGNRKKYLPVFGRMNGTKILVAGNHDECWPGKENSWVHLPPYLEYFKAVQPFLRIKIAGRTVLVSHFPYTADRMDPARYQQYRLRNEGQWLLHGHTHSRIRRTSSREIHIGMDAWDLTPVEERRIAQIITAQHEKEQEQAYHREIPPPPPPSASTPAVPAPGSVPGCAPAQAGHDDCQPGPAAGTAGAAGHP